MDLGQYTILNNDSILEALIKMNDNKQGFLIVEDKDNLVLGTLTDGDIRRSLINGKDIGMSVSESYKRNYIYMNADDDFSYVLDVFKDGKIKFIPVLNKDKRLVNIITKEGLQALMLRDIQLSVHLDFLSIDDLDMNHGIYKRPWGFYKTTILNDVFQSKLISVLPKSSLSFQKHRKREEHWIMVKGEGEVRLEDSFIKVRAGDYIFVPKGCKHRITNLSQNETLIFIEVQLGQYFGEDDIIRFKDDYGRKTNG